MRKALIFILALSCCQILSAQTPPTLPKQVKIGKPTILKPLNGTYKQADLDREFVRGGKWGTKKTEKEFWVVYSDRNRNTLYADPSMSTSMSTSLGFADEVIIAEVKGDMALVYTDSKKEHFPDIPSYAKSMGWIPMENLLLWDKCPTDERGVQYKALIAQNIRQMKRAGEFKGKYYEAPVGNETPKDLQMDMNFYFIMKDSPGTSRVLLSKNPTVFGGNLYGWVDYTAFSRWDQRACLEPNWDKEYNETYKGDDVGVYVDENLSSGNIVTKWTYGNSNGDPEAWNQYRMDPRQLRFPILGGISEGARSIHCTAFSSPSGRANYEPGGREVTNTVESIRQMRSQLNVIFVVEATTEMHDVLPAIKTSIGKWESYGSKVRFGVVLYRGATQGENGLETVALANYNDPQLLSKFDASKANGRLTARDRDVALAQAIEKASDARIMGFKEDQNTLMLVVGSRGAPENDTRLSSSQLQQRLVDNNVQVMSIQVTKNQTGSWVNYNDQMVELIRANVQKQYANIGDRAVFSQRQGGDGYNFYSKKSSDSKEGSVLFAQIRYPKEFGKALTAAEITKYVDNGINKFMEAASTWNAHFEESLGNIEFDPSFLKGYLGEVGYERWKKVKLISAFDGFTHCKDSNGKDYWHYILYLSGDELRKLLDDLKPAYLEAKAKSDDRKPYVDAMRNLVKAHIGQQDDKGIDAKSVDELQELIYGLDVHSEMTSRRTLKDIQDPRAVPYLEYKKMLDRFQKSYEKLDEIRNSGYRYRTKMGYDYYYWIPIEDLP